MNRSQHSLQLSVVGSSRIRAGLTDDSPPPPPPHPSLVSSSSSSSSYSRVLFCLSVGARRLHRPHFTASSPDAPERLCALRVNVTEADSPPHLHPQLRRIWTLCSPFLSPLWGLFSPALVWISLGMPPDWSRSGTHLNLTGAFLTYNRRLFEGCLRAKMKENWSFVVVLNQYF